MDKVSGSTSAPTTMVASLLTTSEATELLESVEKLSQVRAPLPPSERQTLSASIQVPCFSLEYETTHSKNVSRRLDFK